MVMEPVMRTAAMKPEVALLDNDDLETIEGDLDWHFVTLGEQQNFGIKTAGTSIYLIAVNSAYTYSRSITVWSVKSDQGDYAQYTNYGTLMSFCLTWEVIVSSNAKHYCSFHRS